MEMGKSKQVFMKVNFAKNSTHQISIFAEYNVLISNAPNRKNYDKFAQLVTA